MHNVGFSLVHGRIYTEFRVFGVVEHDGTQCVTEEKVKQTCILMMEPFVNSLVSQ